MNHFCPEHNVWFLITDSENLIVDQDDSYSLVNDYYYSFLALTLATLFNKKDNDQFIILGISLTVWHTKAHFSVRGFLGKEKRLNFSE